MFGAGCGVRCQGEAEELQTQELQTQELQTQELQTQVLPRVQLCCGEGAPQGAALQGEPQADVDPSAEGPALPLHSPILHLSLRLGTL